LVHAETLSHIGRLCNLLLHSHCLVDKSFSTAAVTILVVDDEHGVREIIAEGLELAGYNVLQAGSGEDALQILDRHPDLRLVVSDVRMPGISGIELARSIVATGRQLKVILISGFFMSETLNIPCLLKPFRMAELESVVAAQLAA